MIVCKDRCRRAVANRSLDHMTRIDVGVLDCALAHKSGEKDAQLRIETENIENFFSAPGHQGHQVFGRRFGAPQGHTVMVRAVGQITPGQLRKQRKKCGGLRTDTLN